MKLSLFVQSPGKWEGKTIPIKLAQFLVGRDAGCHLRPANLLVSKRHCVLLVRGDRAFVRDLNSTNGTFLNEQPVKGEVELHDRDCLKIGPMAFRISFREATPAVLPLPSPQGQSPTTPAEDEVAATLLLTLEDGAPTSEGGADQEDILGGSTLFRNRDGNRADADAADAEKSDADKAKESERPAKPSNSGTALAAKAILGKYIRRPRS